jgi:hypothetical protein
MGVVTTSLIPPASSSCLKPPLELRPEGLALLVAPRVLHQPMANDDGAGGDLRRLVQPPVELRRLQVEMGLVFVLQRALRKGLDLGVEPLADERHTSERKMHA